MSEEAARKLLADEEFIGKIVEKVYDKLRNDELLKKSDQILKMISESVGRIERIEEENKRIWQEIQSTKEEIKRINERIERIEEENKRINERIERIEEENKRINERIERIEEENKRINERIERIEEENKRINERIERIEEENKRINERIERIEEENKRIWQEIQSTKEEIKRINERIERIEEENTKIWKEIQRMNISFSSFTSRAGHYIERTIMELYKEALSLHGIDPSAVRHVTIIDEKGVVSKGRKFEVDFYETDDAIYVFEVKNFADEGAVEQLEIREKVFQSLYQKPIRLFLIANTIEEEIKETAESMGITVIAGLVVSS